MAENIIGNHDGDKGGNDTYNIRKSGDKIWGQRKSGDSIPINLKKDTPM